MDGTFLMRFQAFTLIVFITSQCASAGLIKYVHVHMTNNLGDGTIIYLHCLRNSKEMGHQQIPYNWTCLWKFKQRANLILLCDANLQGAKELRFVAYNNSMDSCKDNCDWKFTQQGVFQYDNGEWKFRYTWPH